MLGGAGYRTAEGEAHAGAWLGIPDHELCPSDRLLIGENWLMALVVTEPERKVARRSRDVDRAARLVEIELGLPPGYPDKRSWL